MVPLGFPYCFLDVIRELRCEVIVVSRNKLGTLNHTLLTIQALEHACPHLRRRVIPNQNVWWSRQKARPAKLKGPKNRTSAKVVLMEQLRGDSSATTNPALLSQFLRPVSLYTLPFFGGKLDSPQTIKKIAKKIEKTLAQILD